MALTAAEQTIITAFDDATSAVAARIQKLIDAGNTDSPEFVTALQAEVTKLQGMGSDGTVPAPTPQP